MEIRNPKYSAPDGSMIDLEINHPDFGWIVFTASADDSEAHGRDLHRASLNGDFGEIAPYTYDSE